MTFTSAEAILKKPNFRLSKLNDKSRNYSSTYYKIHAVNVEDKKIFEGFAESFLTLLQYDYEINKNLDIHIIIYDIFISFILALIPNFVLSKLIDAILGGAQEKMIASIEEKCLWEKINLILRYEAFTFP